MAKLVVNGAAVKCSEGAAPSTLTVTTSQADGDTKPAGTVNDHVPSTNVAPFGMCKTMANPQVAAATAAAQGVLTPVPCVPVLSSPWSPGASVVTIDGVKALSDDSTCTCAWSGTIEITEPGSSIDVD